jgi:hypothetical protein
LDDSIGFAILLGLLSTGSDFLMRVHCADVFAEFACSIPPSPDLRCGMPLQCFQTWIEQPIHVVGAFTFLFAGHYVVTPMARSICNHKLQTMKTLHKLELLF